MVSSVSVPEMDMISDFLMELIFPIVVFCYRCVKGWLVLMPLYSGSVKACLVFQ